MSETNSVFKAYQANTYLFGGNAPYVEEMYENYLANPASVTDSWRDYFDALQHVPAVDGSNAKDVPHQPVINAFAERAKRGGTKVVVANVDVEMGRKRTAVQQLIANLFFAIAMNHTSLQNDALVYCFELFANRNPILWPLQMEL